MLELPRTTDKGSPELLCGPGTVHSEMQAGEQRGAEEEAALGAETEC